MRRDWRLLVSAQASVVAVFRFCNFGILYRVRPCNRDDEENEHQ